MLDTVNDNNMIDIFLLRLSMLSQICNSITAMPDHSDRTQVPSNMLLDQKNIRRDCQLLDRNTCDQLVQRAQEGRGDIPAGSC